MTIDDRHPQPRPSPSERLAPRFVFHPCRLQRELAAVAPPQAGGRQGVLGLDLQVDYGFAFALVGPDRPLDPVGDFALLGQVLLTESGFHHEPWALDEFRRNLEVFDPDLVFYRALPPYRLARGCPSVVAGLNRWSHTRDHRAALEEALRDWAGRRGVPCHGVPLVTLKRRATGRGNVNPVALVPAAEALFGTKFGAERWVEIGGGTVATAAFALVAGHEAYHADRASRTSAATCWDCGTADEVVVIPNWPAGAGLCSTCRRKRRTIALSRRTPAMAWKSVETTGS